MRNADRHFSAALAASTVSRAKANVVDAAVTRHLLGAGAFSPHFCGGRAHALTIRNELAVAERAGGSIRRAGGTSAAQAMDGRERPAPWPLPLI